MPFNLNDTKHGGTELLFYLDADYADFTDILFK